MSNHADPKKEELLWTIAFARIIFGSNMNIQVPPNLNTYYMKDVIKAGANILVSGTTVFKENNGNIKLNIEKLKKVE